MRRYPAPSLRRLTFTTLTVVHYVPGSYPVEGPQEALVRRRDSNPCYRPQMVPERASSATGLLRAMLLQLDGPHLIRTRRPMPVYTGGMDWEFIYHSFLVGGLISETIYIGNFIFGRFSSRDRGVN